MGPETQLRLEAMSQAGSFALSPTSELSCIHAHELRDRLAKSFNPDESRVIHEVPRREFRSPHDLG